MVDTTKSMFAAQEVADLLCCSKAMVYKLARTGQINSTKLGTMVRIPRAELVRIGAIGEESTDAA